MNREILFKAKRLDNGEWFEGVPVDVTPLVCFASDKVAQEVVMVRAGFADWGMPRGLEYTKVDPSTVCQYTGLTDKNGKKIFEGDIVRRETAYYGKHNVYDEPVVWEDDIENDSFGEPYTSGYCIHGGNWEVIGSIHDGEGGSNAP